MRTRNYGLFALALAVVAAGAMASGVPLQRIAFLGLFLACPVMMFFMMRGMGGSRDGKDTDTTTSQSNPQDHTPVR